jgi:hypothetical protein
MLNIACHEIIRELLEYPQTGARRKIEFLTLIDCTGKTIGIAKFATSGGPAWFTRIVQFVRLHWRSTRIENY